MKIIHKLDMDLAQRDEIQRIDVVQGDNNTRVLELALHSGGTEWEPPGTVAVWMRYCKSDGTKGVYDTLPDGTKAWNLTGNAVQITLAPQMLTVSGMVVTQVVLIDGSDELATFSVQIHVERNPAAGALESEDYLNMLQWMEGELAELLTQAKESGEFNGAQGPAGPRGEDAGTVFEYAVDSGFTGTEEEFREMLNTPCLPIAGGTMQGEVDMGGNLLTGLTTPSGDTDAVNKAYVDKKVRVTNVTLRKTNWSVGPPYTQTITFNGMTSQHFVRLSPAYTGNRDSDIQIRDAWPCITYSYGVGNAIGAVCLDEKPTINLPVIVEIFR